MTEADFLRLLANTVGTILMEGTLLFGMACLLTPQWASFSVCGWSRAGLGIRAQGVRNWCLVMGPFQCSLHYPETHQSCPESWVLNGHRTCSPVCGWCLGSGWMDAVHRRAYSKATPGEREAVTRKVAPWLLDASEEPEADVAGHGQK